NRSVRFRIYTPATTFGNKTDANMRSIVLQLLVQYKTFTAVKTYNKKIDNNNVKYVQAEFSSRDEALIALEIDIPGAPEDNKHFIADFSRDMEDDSKPSPPSQLQIRND